MRAHLLVLAAQYCFGGPSPEPGYMIPIQIYKYNVTTSESDVVEYTDLIMDFDILAGEPELHMMHADFVINPNDGRSCFRRVYIEHTPQTDVVSEMWAFDVSSCDGHASTATPYNLTEGSYSIRARSEAISERQARWELLLTNKDTNITEFLASVTEERWILKPEDSLSASYEHLYGPWMYWQVSDPFEERPCLTELTMHLNELGGLTSNGLRHTFNANSNPTFKVNLIDQCDKKADGHCYSFDNGTFHLQLGK